MRKPRGSVAGRSTLRAVSASPRCSPDTPPSVGHRNRTDARVRPDSTGRAPNGTTRCRRAARAVPSTSGSSRPPQARHPSPHRPRTPPDDTSGRAPPNPHRPPHGHDHRSALVARRRRLPRASAAATPADPSRCARSPPASGLPRSTPTTRTPTARTRGAPSHADPTRCVPGISRCPIPGPANHHGTCPCAATPPYPTTPPRSATRPASRPRHPRLDRDHRPVTSRRGSTPRRSGGARPHPPRPGGRRPRTAGRQRPRTATPGRRGFRGPRPCRRPRRPRRRCLRHPPIPTPSPHPKPRPWRRNRRRPRHPRRRGPVAVPCPSGRSGRSRTGSP